MGTRLFIGNLSYAVTEQELREAFTGDGIELRSVRVALDRETGRPRGFAFVETMTDDGAKASIEKLSGRVLQGRADHRRGGAGQTGRTTPGRLRRRAAPRRLRRTTAPGRTGRRTRAPRGPGGPGGPPRPAALVALPRPAVDRPVTSGPRADRAASAPAGRRPPRPGCAPARQARAGREEEIHAAEAGGAGAWQLAVGPQPRRRVARPGGRSGRRVAGGSFARIGR